MSKKIVIMLLYFTDWVLRLYIKETWQKDMYKKGYFVDGIIRGLDTK